MIVFPAIDIKDKCCVRLMQGDFNKVKIYSENPVEMALRWQEEGGKFLHVVDLDGAKEVDLTNRDVIRDFCKNLRIPMQLGGGIRTEEKVKELLDLGVNRVIVSTLAIENKELLKKLINKYGEKIVVSVDDKDGLVAIKGWKEVSNINSLDFCKELEALGIKTIVYTDISKDGMLIGPNFDIYEKLNNNTNLNIIASGGVSAYEDLKKLDEIGLYGAIVGKALYDGKIDLKKVFEWLPKE